MSEKKPLISIIVPTKNAEKTIERTLKSISNQKYDNFEVLNIDFSDDKTPTITNEFRKKDTRFIYIKSPVLGLAKQRNYGVRVANGKMIVFIDGDDEITPDFLDNLYNAKTKYDADIVCTNILHIDSITNKKLDKINSNSIYLLSNIETCIQLESSRNTQLTLCQGKLINKDFLLDYPVNEEVLNEDEATTYSWYINSKKVVVLDTQDYIYYITPNSLSSVHNNNLTKKIPLLCNSYKQRYNLYKELKNKKLAYLGWKRLIDYSLQYANVFKNRKQDELKNSLRNYYKDNFCYRYFLSHPIISLKMLAKYIRCK